MYILHFFSFIFTLFSFFCNRLDFIPLFFGTVVCLFVCSPPLSTCSHTSRMHQPSTLCTVLYCMFACVVGHLSCQSMTAPRAFCRGPELRPEPHHPLPTPHHHFLNTAYSKMKIKEVMLNVRFAGSAFVQGKLITLSGGVHTLTVLALTQWVLKSAKLFYHLHWKQNDAVKKNMICNTWWDQNPLTVNTVTFQLIIVLHSQSTV